jgi:hypothetical protein
MEHDEPELPAAVPASAPDAAPSRVEPGGTFPAEEGRPASGAPPSFVVTGSTHR